MQLKLPKQACLAVTRTAKDMAKAVIAIQYRHYQRKLWRLASINPAFVFAARTYLTNVSPSETFTWSYVPNIFCHALYKHNIRALFMFIAVMLDVWSCSGECPNMGFQIWDIYSILGVTMLRIVHSDWAVAVCHRSCSMWQAHQHRMTCDHRKARKMQHSDSTSVTSVNTLAIYVMDGLEMPSSSALNSSM
jgi:hypothetical protein